MKTAKNILGVAVALAMTASGTFAAPVMISQLPYQITVSGDYILDPAAVAQPVSTGIAIQITASDVNLELSGQQIDCQAGVYGIVVGSYPYANTNVNHVSINNGTVNAVNQDPVVGLLIGAYSSHVSIQGLDVTGNFYGSLDFGNNTSLKNCTFQSPLAILPNPGPGNSTYEHLTVTTNPYSSGLNAGSPYEKVALLSLGYNNSFKNITVVAGDVQLSATDTYKNFFVQPTTQVFRGGAPVTTSMGSNP